MALAPAGVIVMPDGVPCQRRLLDDRPHQRIGRTDPAWKLADVIDKAGKVPVILVAPASTAAVHFPAA